MNKPILNYDRAKDILYIVLDEGEEHHFTEIREDITIEFNKDNQPIGIEIFNATQVLAAAMGRERLAVVSG